MNKLKQEFIGSEINIVKSTNKSLVGLQGTILDETKNTFKIKTTKGNKIILKNTSTFKINNTIIKGIEIIKKPQDRIKMKV
ncbi:ribonuclease P protein subunit [archaeon]|nr:ribonuclease P protein subunit [archaeon]MBL7056710.1 ribonuclease P protein subunit [Candidatus Woesearchaeota archaeon]